MEKEVLKDVVEKIKEGVIGEINKKFLTREEVMEMLKNIKKERVTEKAEDLIMQKKIEWYKNLYKKAPGDITDTSTASSLVPVEIGKDILEGIRKDSMVRKLVTVFPGDKGKLFVKTQGATAYRTAEGVAPNGGSPSVLKYQDVDYETANLVADTIVSNKLLDNANPDLIRYIEDQLKYSFVLAEEKEFIQGDSANDEMVGLDNSGITVVIAKSGHTTINDIDYDDLVSLYLAVPDRYRKNATWILSSTALGVIMKLKDNNGLPIFNPVNGTIFNRPYWENDYVATSGTDNPVIYFGDWKGYYLFDSGKLYMAATREGLELTRKRQTYILAQIDTDGKAVIKDGMRGLKLSAS